MLRRSARKALGQGKPAQSSWRCPFFAQLFQLNRRNPRLRPPRSASPSSISVIRTRASRVRRRN